MFKHQLFKQTPFGSPSKVANAWLLEQMLPPTSGETNLFWVLNRGVWKKHPCPFGFLMRDLAPRFETGDGKCMRRNALFHRRVGWGGYKAACKVTPTIWNGIWNESFLRGHLL